MSIQERVPPQQDPQSEFQQKLIELSPHNQQFIMNAYQDALHAHEGDFREGKENLPYFTHVEEVARILIEECGISDPEMIAAALLHDTVEDTNMYGEFEGLPNSRRRELAFNFIVIHYSERTARMVLNMTKPFVENIEIFNKVQKDTIYKGQLKDGGLDTIIIKMCDRLHNLRTLGARSKENQIKIVNETLYEYFPLFEKVGVKYPQQTEYLLSEMKKAIDALDLIDNVR